MAMIITVELVRKLKVPVAENAAKTKGNVTAVIACNHHMKLALFAVTVGRFGVIKTPKLFERTIKRGELNTRI